MDKGVFLLDKFDLELDFFMMHCDSRNLSRKTLSSYDQTLRLFQHYLKNEHDITEAKKVKSWHIQKYITHLRERGKYTVVVNEHTKKINHPDNRIDKGDEISDTTIANYLRNIKVFFNYLFSKGRITNNPVENIPNIKPKRKQKKLLSPRELERLFGAMDITKFHEYRLWIASRLILDTGCRVGELLDLKPEDIDLNYNVLLLRKPKGMNQRYVYFSQKMSNDLKRWMMYRDRFSESPWLFPTNRGTQQTVGNFESTLSNVGKRVGIHVTPHTLRNNFAKYYILNGGDFATLSKILGHSSIDVTMKAYLDFADEEVRQRYQKHSPLDNLKL
jgi:integrase/recombinase XerD